MHKVGNGGEISHKWTNKSITSPLRFRHWNNSKLHKLKAKTHLHLKRKAVVQSEATVHRHVRKLLHESKLNHTNTNTFYVSQVHNVDSFVAVSLSYSTGKSVMPVFMLPRINVNSQEDIWDTFDKSSNPCLLNNGVTSLCCIATLVEKYHVSENYKNFSQWMCPNGSANTAATAAIAALYNATVDTKPYGDKIHTYVQNLFPGYDVNEQDSWVQKGIGDSEDGLHAVQLMLSDDFITNHSLLRQWDQDVEISRFFVGVTFSELQHTSKVHNSAALSVLALFRNTTSNKIIGNVITKDAASSIQDISTKIYTTVDGGNMYFFAEIRLRTCLVLDLLERYIDLSSVRYAIGTYEDGVTGEFVSDAGGMSWYYPCPFKVMSELSFPEDLELCMPQADDIHLSITIPIGTNIITSVSNGATFILYIKFETENSIVTSQVDLNDVVLYPYRSSTTRSVDNADVITPPALLSKLSFGYGLTDNGFEGTSEMHVVPMHSNMMNHSVVVMGIAGSIITGAVDYKHALIGLSLDGVIVDDVFTFHFLPHPGNHTKLERQRWTLAAVAAANNLQQAILRDEVFTPTTDPSPRLNPDVRMLDILCDSTEYSLASCQWRNPVIDEQISDDDIDTVSLYDILADDGNIEHSEANVWITENIIMPNIPISLDTGFTSLDFIQNTVPPSGKLMLFHPATSSFKKSTILHENHKIGQRNHIDPVVLWVALVSKSD
jgi:hypothetical protein